MVLYEGLAIGFTINHSEYWQVSNPPIEWDSGCRFALSRTIEISTLLQWRQGTLDAGQLALDREIKWQGDNYCVGGELPLAKVPGSTLMTGRQCRSHSLVPVDSHLSCHEITDAAGNE